MSEKMNFVGKMLTDRDLFGGSMSMSKIVDNAKVSKKDKASFIVFNNDIKAILPLAFNVFSSRFKAVNNAEKVANMNEFNDNENDRKALFDAILNVIDDIGPVGAGTLCGASLIYSHAVEHCYKYFDEYHGKALTVKSQLTNAKKLLKGYLDAPNGVNVEAITNATNQVTRLEKELDGLKKKAGSITLEWRMIGDVAFCADMEKFLCKLAKNQLPMSADEYKEYRKSLKKSANDKKKSNK